MLNISVAPFTFMKISFPQHLKTRRKTYLLCSREQKATRKKSGQATKKLRETKLAYTPQKVADISRKRLLTWISYHSTGAKFILTEHLNREIKRRTQAIGAFSGGQSALMPVCTRRYHIADTQQKVTLYMHMYYLARLYI